MGLFALITYLVLVSWAELHPTNRLLEFSCLSDFCLMTF